MKIVLANNNDQYIWDDYVNKHSDSNICHLFSWKKVVENSYKHQSYYLMVKEKEVVKGILPLFFINSIIFGKQLVSMPFLSYGGILSDSDIISDKLLTEARKIAAEFKINLLEIRQIKTLEIPINQNEINIDIFEKKIRMKLELPQTSDELFKSFKSKLRSQIRRPQKEGMHYKIGGEELLNDFYRTFTVNMRDLGSPVHSVKYFKNLLKFLEKFVKISIVYYNDIPVAAGIIILFKHTVEIPWASSLRYYNRYSPNMLLYWSVLKFSCDNNFQYFDFGRSTEGESTHRFKAQWGAIPEKLHWYRFYTDIAGEKQDSLTSDSVSRKLMITIWKKIPLPIANYLGSHIRGSISL